MSRTPRLGSAAVGIALHATQTLPALDHASNVADFPSWLNESVLQPLVISFGAIMAKVGNDGAAEHGFAEEDQAARAFLAQAAPEAFQMSVQIRRPRRQAY